MLRRRGAMPERGTLHYQIACANQPGVDGCENTEDKECLQQGSH
jgi:hypothetical protein